LWADIVQSLSGEEHDFTTGSLHRGILLLAVPMVLEMSMESVFAVVDIYFVSTLGADAISVVGLTEAVLMLLYAVSIGLGMATTATVARRIGEKDRVGASKAAYQSIVLGCLVSLVIGIPGFLFAEEILGLMRAEPSAIASGAGYTRILLGSNVVIMLLFLINAAFRGAGDPAIAMRSLCLANAINIVLDPCLIYGYGPFPEMGITGAAVATTIGRGSGVAYQFWALARRRGRLDLAAAGFRIDWAAMFRLLHVSAGGIAQMLIATASWVVLMYLVSGFGKEPVAGYTIAVRIAMFTFLPAWGISNSAATLVGQNLGSRQPDRAERAVWLTGLYTSAFLAVVTIVFLSLTPELVGIFTDDPVVSAYAIDALRIMSYGYVFYGWGMVMMQAFNGSGNTMIPTGLNLVCFWMVQIPLAHLLAINAGLGPTGVFWSVTSAESLLAVISVLWFCRGTWKQAVV
jgi:putative MATE family efflux protein